MVDENRPGETVEKIMSITRDEFETGLRRLTGSAPRVNGRDHYILPEIGADRQVVHCSFETMPDAVLGGLVRLPRARVRLHLAALSSEARAEFIALFDRRFQRGGG